MLLKLLIAAGLVPIVWFLTSTMHFPRVFQIMFVLYIVLGLVVFLLLDAPPVRTLGGWTAAATLVVFYVVLSAAYVLGASVLPQYDPNVEKEKIDKIVKPRMETPEQRRARLETLLKKTEELQAKTATLLTALNTFSPPQAATAGSAPAASGPVDIMARGKEVYDLQECYNCHKIGGQGSVKKRGPVLDNIGSLLTIDDIKKKIFDPTYLYAEGFEKEHKKGLMPDKYKELMTEDELSALAAYLNTLKNASVETPKPVFVKTKVEHGFTVYGYVRDKTGKPVAGVEVQAKPLKEHAHAGSTKTNPEGYFEIFLHLHNEDSGTKIVVTANGASKEVVANYDSNDKITKRQASVDL